MVVTGAARGIGRAIACMLAGRGAQVAVLDVENGEETANLCKEAGGEGQYFRCDISCVRCSTALLCFEPE